MAGPKDKARKLSDVVVDEVSLVDRAANKRKFLLVKRDATNKAEDAMSTPKPNTTETVAAPEAAAQTPTPAATQAATPAATPAAAPVAKAEVEPPAPVAKADEPAPPAAPATPEVDNTPVAGLTDALAAVNQLHGALGAGTYKDALGTLVAQVTKSAGLAEAVEAASALSPAAPATAAPVPAVAPVDPVVPEDIAKARRMTSGRAKKFQTAIDALVSLRDEFGGEEGKKEETKKSVVDTSADSLVLKSLQGIHESVKASVAATTALAARVTAVETARPVAKSETIESITDVKKGEVSTAELFSNIIPSR